MFHSTGFLEDSKNIPPTVGLRDWFRMISIIKHNVSAQLDLIIMKLFIMDAQTLAFFSKSEQNTNTAHTIKVSPPLESHNASLTEGGRYA